MSAPNPSTDVADAETARSLSGVDGRIRLMSRKVLSLKIVYGGARAAAVPAASP